MCGMKFESVVVVDTGRLIYFGMKTNIIINRTGIAIPNMLNNSGLDELLQIRHHSMLKIIANIIINVPIPIPNTFPVVV